MTVLPEPPAAPAAGQADNPLTDSVMQAAVRDLIHQASYRNPDPDVPSHQDGPRVGSTPPVPQPGRPPMSQGATDASALMLSGGVASVLVGGAVSLVMFTSGHADPVVCGIVFGSPAALALAVSRLLKRAKGVLPAEITNNYSGPVHHDTRITQTRAVWSKNINRH